MPFLLSPKIDFAITAWKGLHAIDASCLITPAMPAEEGPHFLNHLGCIHSFSFLALLSVPFAYFAARRGHTKADRASMIWLYVGGILIAGAFAFGSGRMLNEWLFR